MDVDTTKETKKEKGKFLLEMLEDMEGDNGHDGRARLFGWWLKRRVTARTAGMPEAQHTHGWFVRENTRTK